MSTVPIDDYILGRIQFHMATSLEALTRAAPNPTKAVNHLRWALALLPSTEPMLLFTFQINAPFQWSASQGRMPIGINALAGWSIPQPLFTGTLELSALNGRIVQLYDRNGVRLSGTRTTPFESGVWGGYADLVSDSGATTDLGLHAIDANSGVAGNSNTIRWSP